MSTPRALSIAEQMDVLRSNADVATFALDHLGLPAAWRDTNQPENTARCQDAVNRVFSLTRADIEAALDARGPLPEQLPYLHTTAGSRDGWYLIPREGEWDYYWQERGFPNFLWTFNDSAELRKLLINVFIPVWLKHLCLPCRTKQGETLLQP